MKDLEIKKAWSRLEPDELAQRRMLHHILDAGARQRAQERKERPMKKSKRMALCLAAAAALCCLSAFAAGAGLLQNFFNYFQNGASFQDQIAATQVSARSQELEVRVDGAVADSRQVQFVLTLKPLDENTPAPGIGLNPLVDLRLTANRKDGSEMALRELSAIYMEDANIEEGASSYMVETAEVEMDQVESLALTYDGVELTISPARFDAVPLEAPEGAPLENVELSPIGFVAKRAGALSAMEEGDEGLPGAVELIFTDGTVRTPASLGTRTGTDMDLDIVGSFGEILELDTVSGLRIGGTEYLK